MAMLLSFWKAPRIEQTKHGLTEKRKKKEKKLRGATTWAILAAVRHKRHACAVERCITWYDSKAAMAIRDMDGGCRLRHSNVWPRSPLHLKLPDRSDTVRALEFSVSFFLWKAFEMQARLRID
jgi:hypothetical protein